MRAARWIASLATVELVGLGLTDDDCALIAASPTLATVTIGDTGTPLTLDGVQHLMASKTVQTLDLVAATISDDASNFLERFSGDNLILINLPDETMRALIREGYSLAMIQRHGARQPRDSTIDRLKQLRKATAIPVAR